jgi:hypothetical protein
MVWGRHVSCRKLPSDILVLVLLLGAAFTSSAEHIEAMYGERTHIDQGSRPRKLMDSVARRSSGDFFSCSEENVNNLLFGHLQWARN